MTLVSVHNSSGCVGRCDARCYDAKLPDCDCICGGANHGVGLERAAANTMQMVETWVEQYATTHSLAHYHREIAPEVYQRSLFEE